MDEYWPAQSFCSRGAICGDQRGARSNHHAERAKREAAGPEAHLGDRADRRVRRRGRVRPLPLPLQRRGRPPRHRVQPIRRHPREGASTTSRDDVRDDVDSGATADTRAADRRERVVRVDRRASTTRDPTRDPTRSRRARRSGLGQFSRLRRHDGIDDDASSGGPRSDPRTGSSTT